MNNLGKRLQVIADLVDGKVVADVGCDHGKLAKYLLDNEKVDYVYISDISAQSLNKAEILLSKYIQKKSILCDGLSGYSDENVDQCIISGMGGEEIIKIISNSPIAIKSFILSPQHNILEVKKFMLLSGYNIVFDIIIKDKNKFYTIIKCEKTNNISDTGDDELFIGRDNFTNNISDIKEYIEIELSKLYNIKMQLTHGNVDQIENKIMILEKAKKELKL